MWNAHTGELIRTLEMHEDLVRTLCFDKERLVSGSYDQSIKGWLN
jgi:WD40 repeat protein